MGGRAFKNLNLTRVTREEIPLVVESIVSVVGLSYEYMMENMMGSCGKQKDSGDIDIAVDSEQFSKKQFRDIFYRAQKILGQERAKAMLKSGQINLAVNIPNTDRDIQVDFIYGKAEWLKFSHWSAGEESNWKGVFISQTFGVLAKMTVLYRYPENAVVDKDNGIDERLAEVAYAYDLENGLNVRCRIRKRGGFVPVTPDEFETQCAGPMPPRVPRVGYIDDPKTVLKILVGPSATFENTSTFEKLLATLRKDRTKEEWLAFSERLQNSLIRSGARYFYDPEDLKNIMNSYNDIS